jgi:hypothetical protein
MEIEEGCVEVVRKEEEEVDIIRVTKEIQEGMSNT